MIISHFPGGGAAEKTTGLPEFTYTGSAQVVDDGEDNWRIKFLTSGTLVLKSKRTVEIFAVGGGGGGKGSQGGGGGGGYTAMAASIDLAKNTEYIVTIGAGGSAATNGGDSSFADILTAIGGKTSASGKIGGFGGSGGGGGNSGGTGGAGGSNGSNGSKGNADGGTGQGTTTREYGESNGTLYSGGGGGGGTSYNATSAGGSGGGGRGGYTLSNATYCPKPGTDNTGGGGGGGYDGGARGGSGIIVIRNVRY